jgi:serine/threonine-protein kinase
MAPGEMFGKFELERKLAVGGMAEIFLASVQGPEGFRKTVAIKRILPHLTEDSDFVTMFLDEARLVARFSHPNIVQIFELGAVDGRYFLAMEYVPGVSMSKVVKTCRKRGQPLPLEYAAKIVSYACEGLDYAHNFADADGTPLNLIHRDVSPQNLMLSYDGVVKVLDFGIAKAAGNLFQTRSSSLKGKAAYMSPEQITQKTGLDRRSDVFALGIVLFEFATGHRPFGGDTELELMMSIVQKEAPDPRELEPTVPAGLASILGRALAKDRDQRFPSCRALRTELEQLLIDRRVMVDTYALGGFLRELIPPGEVKVGMTLPTPSQPSLQAAQVDEALVKARTVTSKSRPGIPAPRPPPAGEDEPATLLTPSHVIQARLEGAPPPPPTPDATVRGAPVFSPAATPSGSQASRTRLRAPRKDSSLGMYLLGGLLVLLIGAGGGYLLLGDPEAGPTSSRDSGRDAGLSDPADRTDGGPQVASLGPGVVQPPEPAPDAGPPEAPADAPQADEPGPPADPPPASVANGGKRKKKKVTPPAVRPEPPRPEPVRPEPVKVATAEPRGKLLVDSRPWTNVTIDGTAYGTTPLGPVELEPGPHELELINKGSGIRVKKQIRILAGQTQRVMEKFDPAQIQVFVKPFGEVFVNGVSKGMTPLEGPITLYEGQHTVRVVNAQAGKEETRRVHLTAGQTQKLIFDLR